MQQFGCRYYHPIPSHDAFTSTSVRKVQVSIGLEVKCWINDDYDIPYCFSRSLLVAFGSFLVLHLGTWYIHNTFQPCMAIFKAFFAYQSVIKIIYIFFSLALLSTFSPFSLFASYPGTTYPRPDKS